MERTILIEKTAKRWKRLELLALGLLFPALLAGLGLMYVSFPDAIAAWLLAGVCFAGIYEQHGKANREPQAQNRDLQGGRRQRCRPHQRTARQRQIG